jgi:aryl-alcohol dehydrogenase-like predicted oxidoreductase
MDAQAHEAASRGTGPAGAGKEPQGARFLDSVEMGTGTWQWGDRRLWGYGGDYGEPEVRAAFQASLDGGVELFDTAETYGHGRSEQLLGEFLRGARRPASGACLGIHRDAQEAAGAAGSRFAAPLLATKFMPRPWRLWRGALAFALKRSLRRLRVPRVDLYQLHFPDPPLPIERWMEALADVVERGLARAVGICNCDLDQTRRAHATLAARGVPLASLQRHYSLLARAPESSGLIRYCLDHHIRYIAWSPLEKGLLSGKYGPDQPPPGERHQRYYSRAYLAQARPLIELVAAIGARRGKSAAQVALNWTMCKGALPIPGAKSAAQLRENAGARGWRLSPDEVARLDEASAHGCLAARRA